MAVFSFLALYADRAGAAAFALAGLWTAAVSVPVTVQLIWWRRRVRAARAVFLLGQEHKRLFETVRGEISSGAR